MATKNKSATNSAVSVQSETEQKYTVDKLRENCRRLFGVSTSTFAGATYGMTGKYSVKEMRSHIDAWGKKGVK